MLRPFVSIVKYLALISLSFCCACSLAKKSREPDYEKDANAVTSLVAKKIQQETNLKLIGTGGGMISQINMMGMSFAHYGGLSMGEARGLLVYCVEQYLQAINDSDKIKPHLCNYPFNENNLEIIIFIYGQDRRDPPVGSLTVASQAYGQVVYKIQQAGRPSMKEILREPYDEAKKLVVQHDPEMKKIKHSVAHTLNDT